MSMQYSKKSIEGILSSAMLFIVVLIVLLQVFARIIPGISIIWTEELSRWMWVWVVCIGWGEVEKDNQHLQMNFFESKIPYTLKHIIMLILDILYILVLVELCFITYRQVANTVHSMAVTLPFNRFVLYFSLLIGVVCVLIRVCLKIWQDIMMLRDKKYLDEEKPETYSV